MRTQVESTFGPPLAEIRETNGCIFLSTGRWSVLLSADEAESFGIALLDAAGEARGFILGHSIPGYDGVRVAA